MGTVSPYTSLIWMTMMNKELRTSMGRSPCYEEDNSRLSARQITAIYGNLTFITVQYSRFSRWQVEDCCLLGCIMDVAGTSGTSVNFQQTKRRQQPRKQPYSLQCSQRAANGPYPVADQSYPYILHQSHSNIILPFTSPFSKWSLRFRFRSKFGYVRLTSPIRATCPIHPISLIWPG
jgi:hypothetical protein